MHLVSADNIFFFNYYGTWLASKVQHASEVENFESRGNSFQAMLTIKVFKQCFRFTEKGEYLYENQNRDIFPVRKK